MSSPKSASPNTCAIYARQSQPFARAFAEMWLFLLELYKKAGHRLTHINIGGGLPVNYLQDTPMAERISERERQMLSATLDAREVLRAAIAEAVTGDDRTLFE